MKETDTHKLWKHIEPHLKKAMQTVYLREVSRSELFALFCYALLFRLLMGCFFLASSSMCILCPLLSLQWEQMQQMEEKEAGALRGICTDFDYRADVKLKHWSLTLKFFSSMQENRILVQERI